MASRTAILNPDGKARPFTLPSKTVNETVTVTIKAAPSYLGSAVIETATWSSEPVALAFTDSTTAADGRSVSVKVAGGIHSTYYLISALCTTSDGQTIEAVTRMRVLDVETYR
jgi:hypothetical protein